MSVGKRRFLGTWVATPPHAAQESLAEFLPGPMSPGAARGLALPGPPGGPLGCGAPGAVVRGMAIVPGPPPCARQW